jgi:hypothetical protein
MALEKSLRRADTDDGAKTSSPEPREARKRVLPLKQQNEFFRRAAASSFELRSEPRSNELTSGSDAKPLWGD